MLGGDENFIVYDYMPNHSLLTHLHGHLLRNVSYIAQEE